MGTKTKVFISIVFEKSGLHGQNALLQTVSNSGILIRLLHSDIELCISTTYNNIEDTE